MKSTAGERTWGDTSHIERTVGTCHTHLLRVKSTAGEKTWGDMSHVERTVGTCHTHLGKGTVPKLSMVGKFS